MILVIVIHMSNFYCRAYGDISNVSYLGATIFNGLARISVPIFFMISGALLIKGEHDDKKYKKEKEVSFTLEIFCLSADFLCGIY